jgi:hypothetical protein
MALEGQRPGVIPAWGIALAWLFRGNARPHPSLGHRPGMALQGQRPGVIPAWGIALAWLLRGNAPASSQPGASPGMALEGQRPGVIPAWGIAPGNGFKTIFSANGAAHHSGGVVWRGCQNVRHDGSGRWPLVAFADGFLGRCPRLGWHRAVGPQESACITRDLDCSPIFRAKGAPPSQPGHRPNMALQGQRPISANLNSVF